MVHYRKYDNNKEDTCTKGTIPTPVFSNFSIYILQHFCRCRQFHGRHHLRDNIEAIIVNLKWFLMRCHNCHFSRTDIYCKFKEICILLAPPNSLRGITHTLTHSTFSSGARQPIPIAFLGTLS